MMPRTTAGIWVLVAMVCAATATRAYDDMGDVSTYWQKRTQEAGFKRGGPLRDLVSAAARYHQELNGNRFGVGGRYLLEEKAAEAPAEPASTGASAAAAPPPAPAIHNTLADHEMI